MEKLLIELPHLYIRVEQNMSHDANIHGNSRFVATNLVRPRVRELEPLAQQGKVSVTQKENRRPGDIAVPEELNLLREMHEVFA